MAKNSHGETTSERISLLVQQKGRLREGHEAGRRGRGEGGGENVSSNKEPSSLILSSADEKFDVGPNMNLGQQYFSQPSLVQHELHNEHYMLTTGLFFSQV
jgi:hypothetical protein